MCGIFGYKWKRLDAYNIIVNWLKRLEYRWYDSAGLAVQDIETGNIEVVKSVGEVSKLIFKVQQYFKDKKWKFNLGIWHTRWATHWWVNLENTHPHTDTKWNFWLVHNGIIENVDELKKFLLEKWYKFYSETDTEIVAKLLEYYYDWDFLKTVEKVLPMLEWAYAFLIINKNHPGQIIWVKFGSPLVFWYNEDEIYFSSDVNALAGLVNNFISLDDGELVYVRWNDFIIRAEWKIITKPIQRINVEELQIEKWNYKHFMLKEIFEQPEIIERFLKWRISFENYDITIDAFRKFDFKKINNIVLIWCWTSYNAAHLGSRWLNNIAGINAKAEIASEFVYKKINNIEDTLFIFISQSGETADTIEALKLVKQLWWKTLWIVNVVWSTISRITDAGVFTRCGPEVGVASTKAFMGQILALFILSLYIWKIKGNLNYVEYKTAIDEIKNLSKYITEILNQSEEIRKVAMDLKNYTNFFFLGRMYQLPIADEASLKFKEITYLHSEAYPAWELKHGPLALIDNNTPSIIFIPKDWLEKENLSSVKEIKARNGKVLAITDLDNIENIDWTIRIPSVKQFYIYPFLTVVVGQLLAYYVADLLWREIDKPRNLAKSVTVK